MKVTINGEDFDYDGTHAPLAECLAIENAYGRRYVEWQGDLQAGSAKAIAALAWLIWRRASREVEFADIMSGEVDLDINEVIFSMAKAAEEMEAAGEVPTDGAPTPAPSPDPDGTPTTGTATSASSRNGSGSAHGRRASSTSATLKR